MKFDRVRNSAEMRELLDYLVCIAIGGTIAPTFGVSRVLASLIVLYVFKHWKKKGVALSPRLRTLAVLACFGVVLLGNWGAYQSGVSAGYEAAAASGKREATKPAHGTKETGALLRG
jgi:hypothetical protein